MEKIIITVSGGLVQNIDGVPLGVKVEIHDYDLSTIGPPDPPDSIRKDEHGDEYFLIEWN